MIIPTTKHRLVRRASSNDTAIYAIVFGLVGFILLCSILGCFLWGGSKNGKKAAKKQKKLREKYPPIYFGDHGRRGHGAARANARATAIATADAGAGAGPGHLEPIYPLDETVRRARSVRVVRDHPQVVFVNGPQQQQQQQQQQEQQQGSAATRDARRSWRRQRREQSATTRFASPPPRRPPRWSDIDDDLFYYSDDSSVRLTRHRRRYRDDYDPSIVSGSSIAEGWFGRRRPRDARRRRQPRSRGPHRYPRDWI